MKINLVVDSLRFEFVFGSLWHFQLQQQTLLKRVTVSAGIFGIQT